MRDALESLEREYRRYKKLAEGTFDQLSAEDLARLAGSEANSVAMLAWHVAGNLQSRFTDLLTSDGEKPWRQRDSEFVERQVTHAELRKRWEEGWQVLFGALAGLSDADLNRTTTIRGEPLTARDALNRSLAHTSYHVGQIVLLGKLARGPEWRTLSIPRAGRAQ